MAATEIEKYAGIQELTEEVWDELEIVAALQEANKRDILERLAGEGYVAVGEPESEVMPILIPHVDPVTGATIVGAIRTWVKCVKAD